MMADLITCPMCGTTFDPELHGACESCPLQRDCTLVCCPTCGYQTVDVGRSRLGSWAARWLSRRKATPPEPSRTLVDVPPGYQARISENSPHLAGRQAERLQAYGLLPGCWVTVVQQAPLTIVRLELLELALEHAIARQVYVDREIIPLAAQEDRQQS